MEKVPEKWDDNMHTTIYLIWCLSETVMKVSNSKYDTNYVGYLQVEEPEMVIKVGNNSGQGICETL